MLENNAMGEKVPMETWLAKKTKDNDPFISITLQSLLLPLDRVKGQ